MGDLRGLPAANIVGTVLRGFPEHPDPGIKAVLLHAGVGLQRHVLRLQARIVLAHHLPENRVDPIQHRLLRAAIFGKGQLVQLPAPLHLLHDAQVCAPKTIYGLLGVAHDEQPSRRQGQRVPGLPSHRGVVGRGQVETDFGLQRVGVLELIDEDAGVATLKIAAGVIDEQQVASPHQQVVEGGRPVGLASVGVTHRETPEEVLHQRTQNGRPYSLLEQGAGLAELCADFGGTHAPVALGSDVARIVHFGAIGQSRRRGNRVTGSVGDCLNGYDCIRQLLKQRVGLVAALTRQRAQFCQRVPADGREVSGRQVVLVGDLMISPAQGGGQLLPVAQTDADAQQMAQDAL